MRADESFDQYVELEDLPEGFKELAEHLGIKAALELTKFSGGVMQYIPKYDEITRAARYRKLKQEFTGANYKALAHKYGLSEIWVRDIIDRDQRYRRRAYWLEHQTSFDF